MKGSYLSIGLLALFSPLVSAWSKEDREIFRIRDEIAAHETDVSRTFYDILEISSSASQDDITKAYRQQSRSLHPDKVKQQLLKFSRKNNKEPGAPAAKSATKAEINAAIKDASERQARLSLIANILRGPGRERYDHFLANGFPLWKGTDYYYNRYRPGLGTVIFGVFLMIGGAVHYYVLYMSWKRQKEFVNRYIKFARDTAWGGNMNIPGVDTPPVPAPAAAAPSSDDEEGGPQQPMNRKQRRWQEKESKKEEGKGGGKKSRKAAKSAPSSGAVTPAPTGTRKRVVAENGKILVVDSDGNVYLEGEDEDGNVEEYLLDPNELAQPTIKDTAIVRVPLWAFNSTVGHFIAKPAAKAEITLDDEDSEDAQHTPSAGSTSEDFEIVDESTDSLSKSAKATGLQQGGKSKKRSTKRR